MKSCVATQQAPARRGAAPRARPRAVRAAPARRAAPRAAAADGAAILAAADALPLAGQLGVYAAKTLVDWLVPLGGVGVVVGVAASAAGKGKRKEAMLKRVAELDAEELGKAPAGGPGGGSPFGALAGKKAPQGAPTEYLKVERLNARLDSYSYSMAKATSGGGRALSAARRRALESRVGSAMVEGLDAKAMAALEEADAEWARSGATAAAEVDRAAKALRAETVAKAAKMAGSKDKDGKGEGEDSGFKLPQLGGSALEKDLEKAIKKRAQAEQRYVQKVASALDGEGRERLAALLAGEGAAGFGEVSLLPRRAEAGEPRRAFVLTFKGDIQASQVNALREEVTAVIRAADPGRGDECVVVLSSGGGTVTGYGLAAAQLSRLKAAGIKLVIQVEQVAASGGYMMACTADVLHASPFAVLGSIGVISEQPNVYERLKKEGIEFTTVTAGKYKRTLTPTKKIDPKDMAKSEADVKEILSLFKEFVGKNRPSLDIDNVATGETWFGEQAVEKGLCDALMTADDYLLKLADAGAEVFSIRYAPPPKAPSLAALSASAASAATSVGVEAGALGGLRGALGSWLLSGAAPQPQGPGYYVADPMAGAERADSGVGGVGVDEWPDW